MYIFDGDEMQNRTDDRFNQAREPPHELEPTKRARFSHTIRRRLRNNSPRVLEGRSSGLGKAVKVGGSKASCGQHALYLETLNGGHGVVILGPPRSLCRKGGEGCGMGRKTSSGVSRISQVAG